MNSFSNLIDQSCSQSLPINVNHSRLTCASLVNFITQIDMDSANYQLCKGNYDLFFYLLILSNKKMMT